MQAHTWYLRNPAGPRAWKCSTCGKLDFQITPDTAPTCKGPASALIDAEIALKLHTYTFDIVDNETFHYSPHARMFEDGKYIAQFPLTRPGYSGSEQDRADDEARIQRIVDTLNRKGPTHAD